MIKKDIKGSYNAFISYNPWTHEINKYNSKLELILTMVRSENKPTKRGEIAVMRPALECTISREGYVVWGNNNKYELNVVNPEGKLIKRISKKHNPVKISRKEKNKIIDKYSSLIKKTGTGSKLIFPRHYLTFMDVSLDDIGRIFVATVGANEKEYIDIFDKEGKYIAKVAPEINLSRISWRDNKIYSVTKDEKGFPIVKRYRIIWNKNF